MKNVTLYFKNFLIISSLASMPFAFKAQATTTSAPLEEKELLRGPTKSNLSHSTKRHIYSIEQLLELRDETQKKELILDLESVELLKKLKILNEYSLYNEKRERLRRNRLALQSAREKPSINEESAFLSPSPAQASGFKGPEMRDTSEKRIYSTHFLLNVAQEMETSKPKNSRKRAIKFPMLEKSTNSNNFDWRKTNNSLPSSFQWVAVKKVEEPLEKASLARKDSSIENSVTPAKKYPAHYYGTKIFTPSEEKAEPEEKLNLARKDSPIENSLTQEEKYFDSYYSMGIISLDAEEEGKKQQIFTLKPHLADIINNLLKDHES